MNPSHQGDLYIPPHFQEQFDQEFQSLLITQEAADVTNTNEVPRSNGAHLTIVEVLGRTPPNWGQRVDFTHVLDMIPNDETDSHEYEFDSFSYATSDRDTDTPNAYENLLEVGERSSVGSHDSDSLDVNMSSTTVARNQRNLTIPLHEIALGLDLLIHAFDDYTMNALEPVTPLSLCHLELIDCTSPSNEVLTF